MIYSNEPLRAATGGRQHVRAGSELNLTTINPRPRVDTKRNIRWRAHATKIAESAQIEVEPGISCKKRAQRRDRTRSGDLQRVVRGGMQAILLETGKEKVLSFRTGPPRVNP